MHLFDFLRSVDFSSLSIPVPVALAALATLGYLLARRTRGSDKQLVGHSKRELRRARHVARELERIAWTVRKDLARHQASVNRFKQRVGQLASQQDETAWKELYKESQRMLSPTLHLANQIANAYDQIRQQGNHLMTFTEVRTDPLTGVGNRRGLDDALTMQFALMSRYEREFSVVIFDIDHFKQVNDQQGHLHGDRILQRIAQLLDECVRETDVVTRYGGEEFVVVTPQTDLAGASLFAERWRAKVEEELPVTVSGGVASALDGETSELLLARADSALYNAKAAGRNCICRHNGEEVESVLEKAPA